MALTFNGTTPTVITYNGTTLTAVTFNGTAVWSSSSGTTYRWQKSYVAQSITYVWDRYNLIDTGYYGEYSWSSPVAAGFSDIEGYTSLSFATTPQSGGGYSYSGWGMAQEGSADIVYVGNATSVTKYYGSGGVLYSSYKSCRWIAQWEMGSYIDEVSSTNSTAYPTNANGGDGYYYIYDRQTTIYTKGANIEVVTSTVSTTHNQTSGGAKESDGYWYTYLGTA